VNLIVTVPNSGITDFIIPLMCSRYFLFISGNPNYRYPLNGKKPVLGNRITSAIFKALFRACRKGQSSYDCSPWSENRYNHVHQGSVNCHVSRAERVFTGYGSERADIISTVEFLAGRVILFL